MTDDAITLPPAEPADLPALTRAFRDAFAVAVVEEFGPLPDGPIPSDAAAECSRS